MTPIAQTRRRPTVRNVAFGVAALPLVIGSTLMITNHAAGIAWALLVCGAGLLSVALTQPRREHEPSRSARADSAGDRPPAEHLRRARGRL